MNALEKKHVALLTVIIMARMLGLFMLLPVFVEVGKALDYSTPETIGLAIGIYGLLQACLQIPFGMLSDKYGRKPLVIFGLSLFIIGSIVAALSSSIYGVIIGRAIQGAGAVSSVIMAWVSDVTAEENRSKAMAVIGMSIGIAFSLAMVVSPFITAAVGLSGLFWVITLLAVLSLGLSLMLPSKEQAIKATVSLRALWLFITGRQWIFNLGVFVLHLIMTSFFMLIPTYLKQRAGIDLSYHGYLYLGVMLVSFFAIIPVIIKAEKNGKLLWALCFGAFSLAMSLLLLLVSMKTFSLSALLVVVITIVAMIVYFFGFNLLEALMPSWISRNSARHKGAAMGAYSTSQFLGAFTGGMLGGYLIDTRTLPEVVFVLFVLAILWFGLLVRYYVKLNDSVIR